MAGFQFGTEEVTPAKMLNKEYTAGTGISSIEIAKDVIAVGNDVMHNKDTKHATTKSFIDSNSFGSTSGSRNIVIGHEAGTGTNVSDSVVIGASSNNQAGSSVVIGYGAKSNINWGGSRVVVIGAEVENTASNSVSIGNNVTTTNYAYMGITVGSQLSNSGNSAVLIGRESSVGYNAARSVVIGTSINTSHDYVVAIGNNISTPGNTSVAIGVNNTLNSSDYAVVIGQNNQMTSYVSWGVNIGNQNRVGSYTGIAIGASVTAGTSGYQSGVIAIGSAAKSENTDSIAIGTGATSTCVEGIAIGKSSLVNSGQNGVAIGRASHAWADGAIALGTNSDAQNIYATALGCDSNAQAFGAIQLGGGVNTEAGTLKVGLRESVNSNKNYTLLKNNGVIPYERFSRYYPENGYVLTYDSSLDEIVWKEVAGGSGSTKTPIATKTTVGVVKAGEGLDITSDGTLSVADASNVTWGKIKGTIKNQTDLQKILDNKQEIIQLAVIPEASEEYDGKVVQYIGETDSNYKKGTFYECRLDNYPSANITSDTYWDTLKIDPVSFANAIANYFYNDEYDLVPSKLYTLTYKNMLDGYGWAISENDIDVYVKDLEKFGIKTGSGSPVEDNRIYVELNLYSTTNYIWKKLAIAAEISVNNTLTSTSTKQALSANQGRILNDKVEQLSSISHFLAMWDSDTGLARYLEEGYEYHSGDYFIIATVGESSPSEHGSYTARVWVSHSAGTTVTVGEITNTELDNWEDIFGKKAQRVIFSLDASSVMSNPVFNNNVNSELYSRSWFQSALNITLTNFMSIGDSFAVNYSSPVNYMPDGTSYQGASTKLADTGVDISDMYFYDGNTWIYLANSSRSIAVDEALDDSSRNPVENRVVTTKFRSKVDKSGTANIIYGNDTNGTQIEYHAGEGIKLENGQIINTKEDGTWGKISGNINAQSDLIALVNNNSGGGLVQMNNVTLKQNNISEALSPELEWKGDNHNIVFTLNVDREKAKTLINDLYVTVSRYKKNIGHRGNDYNNVAAYKVQNEQRVKTTDRIYCWRMREHEDWEFNNTNPRSWYYFYTIKNYNNDVPELLATGMSDRMGLAYGMWCPSNYGTNLNIINWEDRINDYIDVDYDGEYIERYEDGDIDTIIIAPNSHHGENFDHEDNWPKYSREQLEAVFEGGTYTCRKYNRNGSDYFLWSIDWEDDAEDVYVVVDEGGDAVANKIANFWNETTNVWTVSYVESNFSFVAERKDLNFFNTNLINTGQFYQFHDIVYKPTLIMNPCNQGRVHWNSYFFDYPIKPTLLGDCEVVVTKRDDDAIAAGYGPGDKVKFRKLIEEGLVDNALSDKLPITFVMPWDTYYLWMRFSPWQKKCFHEYEGDEEDAHFYCKNDLSFGSEWESNQAMFEQAAFGHKKYGTSDTGMLSEKLAFNLADPENIVRGSFSKYTPTFKRLTWSGQRVQGLK